jgi:sec-independent protein translocase protein TatB
VFGIGMTELLVVLVVALLVLGPRRLPEIARSLGRGMAEFRRASSDLRATLTASLEDDAPGPPSAHVREASGAQGPAARSEPQPDEASPSGGQRSTARSEPRADEASASGGQGPTARSEP